MYTTKECVHFPCFAGYVQTWCARPRVQCFFLFFLKILFSYNLSIVCYASICAHRVCTQETDGLMLLELLLKGSAALPVHCAQP